ncbi:Eukaryotic-type DNA primase, large subunit [Halapricum desulfuricans]|uniref:DNA primase large subunit PriL n=1 Tax=Halapricum desulfuricans TaxID=2841257 RepID=A0A897NKK2_9EURY|nr:DNA primase regulatory subunit PriL [Halapricum desulfuricans]QSG13272.1 Eukaryotic-type DNA primase, large subunit [Halapricum desulfuricans]
MKPLHARYPFMRAAREAVEAAEIDLATVVQRGGPAVERGLDRVESALEDGTVGEPHRESRVELLSYPIARVLVSIVDEAVLTRSYARAEASSAHDRFTAELASTTQLRSTSADSLTLRELLAEFELLEHVRPESGQLSEADRYWIDVGPYLDLAAGQWGEEWRLVNRPLADGEVPLEESELLVLCRRAVEQRVESGLPLSVPDVIAEPLEEAVARIRETLAELDLTRDIDTVVPDLFPPCMRALLDQIQQGEHLEHHSRFAITSFLTSIGMSTDEIVELYQVNPGFGEEMTRYQTEHIRGETSPTEYSTPSCATMQSYGDCVNMDDRCERISHPMAYYEDALEDADEDEVTDWRERQES